MSKAREIAELGDAVTVDGSNVGIGTSSPASKVHLQNASGGSEGYLKVTDAVHGGDVRFGMADGVNNDAIAGVWSNNNFSFYTNSSERMRIDSSGNIGIGTTSPNGFLDVAVNAAATRRLEVSYENSVVSIASTSGTTGTNRIETLGIYGDTIRFYTDNTTSEAMRIDADGNLAFNRTSANFTSGGGIHLHDNRFVGFGAGANGRPDFQIGTASGTSLEFRCGNGADTADISINPSGDLLVGDTSLHTGGKIEVTYTGSTIQYGIALQPAQDNGRALNFKNAAGTTVGSISNTSSATSYNTASDYRLKENVVELIGATARLKQLEPKRFNFISDTNDTTVDGFLAHEVQTVVPEAITGTHNEVDADGNPVYQGIDQAKLVPLLVATIKELEARITALEAN